MLSIYPACFFRENNQYSVIFPDLNWLATQGDSFQEAMEMAVDCLAGYLYSCQKDGEEVPPPSALSDISLEEIAKEEERRADYDEKNRQQEANPLSVWYLLTLRPMQSNTLPNPSKRHSPFPRG